MYVNPRTFRPQYLIDEDIWEVHAESKFKIPLSKMFSGFKYYQFFLRKHLKIPTKEELMIFYYNRYVIGGKKDTLPYLIERWTE